MQATNRSAISVLFISSLPAVMPCQFRHSRMAHRPVPDTDYHEFPPAATPGSTRRHPFRPRRSAGQSAPQQVLYFRPDPQGQGLVAPTLRPNADGSLKSNPAGKLAGPLSPFPTCWDFVHAFSWNTSDSIRRAIDDSAFCPREDGCARLPSHRTLLSNPAESVTFPDPDDPVRHRAYPTAVRFNNQPRVGRGNPLRRACFRAPLCARLRSE